MSTHLETSTAHIVSVLEFAQSMDVQAGRRELVQGAIVMEPYPGPLLPARVAAIALPIFEYLANRSTGRCLAPAPGFVLAFQPPVVRVPDVAFIRNERLERMRKQGCVLIGHPDLAALVVTSPDRRADAQARADDLRQAGTGLVWLIDPWDNRIAVLAADKRELRPGDILSGDPVLPGFRCPVEEVLS